MSNPKLLKKTSASVLSALLAAVPAMGGVAAVATTVQASENDEGDTAVANTNADNASLAENSETGEPNDGSDPSEDTETSDPEEVTDNATEEQVATETEDAGDETSAVAALSKDADGRYHINLFNLDFDSRIPISTNFRLFKDGNNNGKFDGESIDPTVGTPLESSTKNQYQMQGLSDGTYFVKVEGINTPGYTVPQGIATVKTSDMIPDTVAGDTANPTEENPTDDGSDKENPQDDSSNETPGTDDTNKTDDENKSDSSDDSGSKSSSNPLSNLADLLDPSKITDNLKFPDLSGVADGLAQGLQQGFTALKDLFTNLGAATKSITGGIAQITSKLLNALGSQNLTNFAKQANDTIFGLLTSPLKAMNIDVSSLSKIGDGALDMMGNFAKSVAEALGKLGQSTSDDNVKSLVQAVDNSTKSNATQQVATPSATAATKSGTDASVKANETTADAAADAADSMSQSDITKIDDALKSIATQVLKASKEDEVQQADQEDKLTNDLSDTQKSAKILSEEGLAGVSQLQESDSLLDSITDGISKLTGGSSDSSKKSDSSSNSAGSGLLGNLFGGSLFKGSSLIGNLIGSQLRILANIYALPMNLLGMDKNKSFIYSTLMKLSNKLTGHDDGSDSKSDDNPNENGKDDKSNSGKDTEPTEDKNGDDTEPITPSNDADVNQKLSDNTKIDTKPYSPDGALSSDAPVVTKGSVTFYSHKNGSGANGANVAVNTGSFPIVPVAISAGASSLALGAYMVLKKKKISE